MYIDYCWFQIEDSSFKVKSEHLKENNILLEECVDCKFAITSSSYQQNICGCRYCLTCYKKLKSKYYCLYCKEEQSDSIVHSKDDIFEDKALKKDLEKINIKCPDCSVELNILNLEEHVGGNCEEGWQLCNNCQRMHKKKLPHDCKEIKNIDIVKVSEYKISNEYGKELEQQAEEHKFIMNSEESCPFNCFVEYKVSTNHRKEASLSHIDYLWAIMKELRMSECKSYQCSTQFTTWYDSSIENIKTGLAYDSKNIQSLKNEVISLKKEMDQENEIHENIKTNLLNQLSVLHSTNYDGTIMWRVDNFSKLREEASLKGTIKSFISPPFFTSKFGYKMCLRLYPNGDTVAHGTALSLFLVIMKGNYDAMLKWPFKQKVTFTIIDPELKKHWSDSFQPSESMPSFTKPKADMNIPAGFSLFIKFDELYKNKFKYAKDDILFIRCVVDCSNILD